MTVVRRATSGDADLVVEMVGRLIRELSGTPDRVLPEGSRSTAEHLLGDPSRGLVLIAEQTRPVLVTVGLLAVSFPYAVRAGGRYAVIEELFVCPEARGAGVGAALVSHLLAELAPDRIRTVEVGLPPAHFPDEPRTRSFYARQGFREVGWRMRLQKTDA